MAVGTDLWELILDIKQRFDALNTPSQFVLLSLASLFSSFIYGYLLDGWINDEVRDNFTVIAQSENLFAMIASVTHAVCAAAERVLRDAFRATNSGHRGMTESEGRPLLQSVLSDPDGDHHRDRDLDVDVRRSGLSWSGPGGEWSLRSVLASVFGRAASLRAYMVYSTLESVGVLCLNWSLLYVDNHVLAIFKSNKIIVILIGEVFLVKTKEDISGVEVASILGVAVSMMLLSLSELDELSHFDFGGIPLIVFGIASSAAAPILAKQYIFSKYQPPRTEVLFFHKLFTAIFLFLGAVPQFVELFVFEHWFDDHLLGLAEMLMLSVVSYFSLSLMMIIIDIFGPTNSELVECTSLVSSVLFSYYFIESGSEFVVVHIAAMSLFVVAFGLNLHSMAQRQTLRRRIHSKHQMLSLQHTLNSMTMAPNDADNVAGNTPND